jgi:ABC-type oligopeptide transport system substrate-binding subunit
MFYSVIIFFVLLFFQPAYADESYGLAMHGTPKYSQADQHLSYVNPEAPKGGTLKLSAMGSFDNLNPFAIKGKAAEGLNLYYDRLMQRVWDEPFTLYPLIAEKIEVADDRSSFIVTLNKEARFHDGSPITADDVIFSFSTLRDFGRPNMRRVYKLVTRAEKQGADKVYFEFGPGFDQETVMIVAMMPILSKAWWEGKSFDSTILDFPLSSGPYKISEVDPGRRIVYERDQNYWAKDLLVNKGHFNFDRIVYDYYRDDIVSLEAFKAGEYDLRREWNAGKWASEYNFDAVASGDVKIEELSHGRPEKVRGLIFNTRRTPFDEIKVRKALNHIFDFHWINNNLYHGRYKRIDSYFPNSELAARGLPQAKEVELLSEYSDSLPADLFEKEPVYPYFTNPKDQRAHYKLADQLLNEAGWSVVDGKRVNKHGELLEFEILLESSENEKIALTFKKALERAGITVNVRVLDAAAYRGRLNEYDFDMTIYYWSNSLSPGTEQMVYWSCEAASQPARWNFAGVCSEPVDYLAKHIAAAESREELVASARALDRVLLNGYYMIPLYYLGKDYVAYKSFIEHPAEMPLYGMVLESWWAKTTQ